MLPPISPLWASLAIPAIAGGAVVAAVAVPILIHLLFRQRFQVVEWAAMRFLSAAKKKSQRRVDKWLLLAMRILAILLPLLAMLAATPWVEPLWQWVKPGTAETIANAPRTHQILVVDQSLSMSAKTDERSRWEIAIEKAEAAIRGANPGDGFTLIALGNQAAPVVPGPSNDIEKVVAELRALKITHGTADLASGLAAINDTLARSPKSYPRRQVMLFTDLQTVAWSGLLPKPETPTPELWTKLVARGDLAIVDCAKEEIENTAVTAIALADPLPLVNDTATVTAIVQHFGKTPRQRVRLELLLGRPAEPGTEGSLVAVEQQVVDLPANEASPVRFTLSETARFRTPGMHAIHVRIVEPDDLPADDARTLTVEVRDGLPCVLVNGKASSVPLQRAAESLSDAIAPGGKSRPGHPGRPRTIGLEEFTDATLSDLSNVDCVFLCDVPTFTPSQIARLDTVLKRGGGVVFGLGPNAAANAEHYNRVLFADGTGLLPGKIGGVASSTTSDDPGFRLVGDDLAFRQPPLAPEFQEANARGGLTAVPFYKYVKLELPQGKGKRILSFASAAEKSDLKPEPAVVEWSRHRGRVIVYTSTFNRDWNDWPILPTYPVFAGELLRFAATNPERQSLRVGESIEEFLPPVVVGLSAKLTGPFGAVETSTVVATDEGGVARFSDTHLAGLYRVGIEGRRTKYLAVNVPDSVPGGGSESDLRRLPAATLRSIHPTIQVVNDPTEIAIQGDDGVSVVTTPRSHGPMLARWFVTVGLLALAVELWIAWRLGPARSVLNIRAESAESRSLFGSVFSLLSVVCLLLAMAILFTLVHSWWTGELLGFLPDSWRKTVERSAGVPGAGPGEGTRWRLEHSLAFTNHARTDQQVQWGLAAFAVAVVAAFYGFERRATGGLRRVLLPALLRLSAYLLAIFLVLPQLRLAFDREGWPDIAIIVDSSASMATVDDSQDPAVRAKIESVRKLPGLADPQRVQLAKWLLTRPDDDWLARLVEEKKVKVHVYSLAEQARLLGTIDEANDLKGVRDSAAQLVADGDESRLGDGVQAVLKTFRGGALAAIILFTDGVTTAGDDLPCAGREAARADVPLYIVGLGDAKDTLDLSVGDLRAEEVIAKNDELVFEARLTGKGPGVPKSVRVSLMEKIGTKLEKRDETTVNIGSSSGGKPVTFRLKHVPTDIGERTYIIEAPVQPGEMETANNKIERQVVVTENRRLRVLFVEGYPRYEFRFVKVLLEREMELGRKDKAVELQTLLLDASADHATTDRTALRGFPTRNELFEYDVVVLGDVDPKLLDTTSRRLQDLAEFVKVKGGGLVVIAGEQMSPLALIDTPLGDVLPISRTKTGDSPRPTSEQTPITEGYRPKLTPVGASHPIFRFAATESESANVWNRLRPMYWSASGYTKKLTAEVLAVHPERAAEDDPSEKHPIVLQQFAGAGRVLFLGFDETWRWRFRKDEEQFNRFWRQTITVMARNRVRRVEMKTDKQTAYRRDEPIKITVQFPDDSPPPGDSVKVGVERGPLRDGTGKAIGGDIETQTLALAKVRGSRATYETVFTRTPVGEYRFTLTDPAPTGLKPKAEARVLPPPGERDRLEMNKPDLTRAASESRGQFYTFADAEKLLDDLPEVARLPLNQPCPPLPVWNHIVTFALLLSLLGCEWILRKRERLL